MKARAWVVLAAAVGVAVGFAGGLLVGHCLDSGWVEAAGTWVGGLGTIGAVLFAVHTLRTEQGNRSQDIAYKAIDRAAAAHALAEADAVERVRDASLVQYRVLGGAGFGGEDDFTMTTLRFELVNASDDAVTRAEVVGGSGDFRWNAGTVQPHSDKEESKEHEGLRPQEVRSRRRKLTSYSTALYFTHRGYDWVSGATPHPSERDNDLRKRTAQRRRPPSTRAIRLGL